MGHLQPQARRLPAFPAISTSITSMAPQPNYGASLASCQAASRHGRAFIATTGNWIAKACRNCSESADVLRPWFRADRTPGYSALCGALRVSALQRQRRAEPPNLPPHGSSNNPNLMAHTHSAPSPNQLIRFYCQRRRRDSNPRYPYEYAGFQNRCLKPLGHSSKSRGAWRFAR